MLTSFCLEREGKETSVDQRLSRKRTKLGHGIATQASPFNQDSVVFILLSVQKQTIMNFLSDVLKNKIFDVPFIINLVKVGILLNFNS